MAHADSDAYDSDTDSRPDGFASDDQSPYEESPVDGYFAERRAPHPQQVYVENPIIATQSNAKTSGDQQKNTSQPSGGGTSLSASWENHCAAILHLDPPPPDYAAATANWSSPRSSMPRSTDNRQDHIPTAQPNDGAPMRLERQFSFDNAESRNQRQGSRLPSRQYSPGEAGNAPTLHQPGQYATFSLVSSQPGGSHLVSPQCMSDQAGGVLAQGVDEETALLSRRGIPPHRNSKFIWRRRVRPGSIMVFLLVAALIIFIAFTASQKLDGGYKHRHDWPFPGKGDDNDNSDEEKQPVSDDPPNASLPHPDTSTCSFNSFRAITFDFERMTEFSMVEFLEPRDYRSTRVTGAIRVTVGDFDQDSDIRVWISEATMLPWQIDGITYIRSSGGLLLQAPLMSGTGRERPSQSPCLDLYIQVSIRPGLNLLDFEIASGNLNVHVDSNSLNSEIQDSSSSIRVTNRTEIAVLRGNIKAAAWSSRETYVNAVSGHVGGNFSLLDVVDVRTHSGEIDIAVNPQEADNQWPGPARFVALANSGAINVQFPTETDIPQRHYITRIETASGRIRGSYILGATTSLNSLSGSVKAELLPFYTSNNGSKLDIKSTSGSIDMYIKQAHPNSSHSWAGTTHAIRSSTGAITLHYEGWEGVFEGQSISGNIRLKGQDWRIISGESPGRVWEYIRAKKGSDGGRIQAATHSGSITMKVADEER